MNTAEVLLRAGISRDARTKVDRTPLHVAAQDGHVDIVELLLQHAADIDAKDMLKMTPLHWATEKGHASVVDTLLKSGANVNLEDKFDRTPLEIAIINGRPDVVQIIQMAQHTDVACIQEPTETITVETSEVGGDDSMIDESGHITIEGHAMSSDNDDSNLLLQNMRHIKAESPDDSNEEGNSTSVLATLAALAEATAQTNTSTTEAINWLESQGITMISATDGNIISSAVESGHSITLTEAGKIALNIMKQQGLTQDGSTVLQDVDGKEQHVITYVSKEGELQTETAEGIQIHSVATIGAGEAGDMVIHEVGDIESDEPLRKRQKLSDEPESTEIDVDSMLQKEGAGDSGVADNTDDISDQEKLRLELEEIRRQAEEYKQQLKQKDRDLEEYKTKLGEMSDTPEDKS